MSFSDDEEILEDFLIEAGEILEQLSEQLVELERCPDDADLLNAIFRGFHTVKGGAGFLQLTPLVDCCHITENLFDMLRNGERSVTSELMDVVLQVLDSVNLMFDQVKERAELTPADPALLAAVTALVNGEGAEAAPAPSPEPEQNTEEPAENDDVTDEEFEQMLAALDKPSEEQATAAQANEPTDEITDEEFEALLDTLQSGKSDEAPAASAAAETSQSASESSSEQVDSADEDKSPNARLGRDQDDITDQEFEALLDTLHGQGKHQGLPVADSASTGASSTPKSEPPKVDKKVDTPAPAAQKKPESKAPAPKPAAAKPQLTAVKGGAQEPVIKEAAPETTVRVDTRRLDEIMNMVGELVLVRNRLVRIGSNSVDEILSKAVANLDLVTADLQTSVMKTRMQPIRKVFGRFPRVVRDLARSLGKEVTLELHGEDTDLDKNLVEALADPLVHLVRNAVDHGIETPDVREANGKIRQGTILLAAEQEGDHILLTISDDGNGMDANVLRDKAVEKGVLDREAADRLADEECYDLIFAPGFSTKTEISDVSGRGVGMDVVKTKITQLNGSIYIQSRPGKGSRIEIKVPLTLAIMPTLMVMVGEQAFALPLVSVNEIFHLDLKRTNIVDGQQVVTVRDKSLPLFHLKRWLISPQRNEEQGQAHVVIVTVGTQRIGFVVDHLIGQEEVVIKPLGKMLHGTAGMAGATITGDGRIALILDVPGLLKRYAS
ncbi:MAG: chemotaxis protein CheA [Pseudohongiellaceae bacterium]|nr:chemotaxis protein CheA [Pseudohongiellaceae bacterium]